MSEGLQNTSPTKDFLQKLSGLDQPGGNERLKRIVQRIVSDNLKTIDDFDVTPEEFWTAMGYLGELGQQNETGLLAAGLGLEHFLDLRFDEKEQQAGLEGGTPRTIEDVWHANPKGGYSFFDLSQSSNNLHRRIETDAEGVTVFGPSCRWDMAVRRTGRRKGFWTSLAAMGSARRTSTSLCPRRATGS